MVVALSGVLVISLFKAPKEDIKDPYKELGYEVLEIEGCQYIKMENTPGKYILTHKGNCSNHKK